jgi:hypothetical protein
MKPAPSINPGQALAAALENEIPEYRLARTISEAMTATMTTRAGTVEIDHKTRLAATSLALAYRVGLPVQRSETVMVNLDADQSDQLRERLAKSPALRRSLARMLAAHTKDDAIDATEV